MTLAPIPDILEAAVKNILFGLGLAMGLLLSACSLTENDEAPADAGNARPTEQLEEVGDPCAPSVARDLFYQVAWDEEGERWRVLFQTGNTDSSTEDPYVCPGKKVFWTVGNVPSEEEGTYYALFHIRPGPFENADETSLAITRGEPGQRPVGLAVREQAEPDTLYYCVLLVNPEALGSRTEELEQLLQEEDLAGLLRFSTLTFASEDSPPKIIIR